MKYIWLVVALAACTEVHHPSGYATLMSDGCVIKKNNQYSYAELAAWCDAQ